MISKKTRNTLISKATVLILGCTLIFGSINPLTTRADEKKVKNVIYLIADGMSDGILTAAKYYKDIQDELQALLDANNRYKWDSAHEMGHKVLDEYGEGSSPDYSWTHKGTSTLMQKTIPGNVMPAQGEIDVMKYGKYRPDMYTRLVAADEDVQGLIWLSRIKFDD